MKPAYVTKLTLLSERPIYVLDHSWCAGERVQISLPSLVTSYAEVDHGAVTAN
jgi:hypothetical protein